MLSLKLLVRVKGLEPPHLSTLEPKSSAATNYATPALFMVPPHRIELRIDDYKSTVIPFNYKGAIFYLYTDVSL